MIICFEVVLNRVLSNSKTRLIVKLETFHIYAERARDSVGVVARFARTLTLVLVDTLHGRVASMISQVLPN
jgi:hypothetical protein